MVDGVSRSVFYRNPCFCLWVFVVLRCSASSLLCVLFCALVFLSAVVCEVCVGCVCCVRERCEHVCVGCGPGRPAEWLRAGALSMQLPVT